MKSITQIIRKTDEITIESMSEIPLKSADEGVMSTQIIKLSHDLMGEVVSKDCRDHFDEDLLVNAIVSNPMECSHEFYNEFHFAAD